MEDPQEMLPPPPVVLSSPPAAPPQPPPQDVLPPRKAPTPLKSISAACPLSTHDELSNLENSILRYMAHKRLDCCSVAKLQSMIDALPGLSDSVKAALTPPPSEPASGLLSRCLEEICDNLSSAKMMLSDGQVYSTFS